MGDNQILVPLKIDLHISSLDQIHAAEEYIKTEGIKLDPNNFGDRLLVEMYAAHLYRSRRDTGDKSKMPRMLRWALNNRLFSQKISEG